MTDLTEQEIVDAIDRALERVEQRFAASIHEPDAVSERPAMERPVGRTKKVGRISEA
jgi:hypothetical protein